MFTFAFAGTRYEVDLDRDVDPVRPNDKIGPLLVESALEEMMGSYFPSAAVREFILSSKLGGDAAAPSERPADLPEGAVP